jgi:hypothetical protein
VFVDPLLAALDRELHAHRMALREAVELVPRSHRQTRPAPDRWSTAEVIAHLALVELRIAQLLGALGAAAPHLHDADDVAPSAAVDMERLLDRTLRFEAPAPLHPPRDAEADAGWAALEGARESLHAAMRAVDGRALGAVTRPHPALGVLNGYQWIASVAGHEARHAAQIREIASALAASPA